MKKKYISDEEWERICRALDNAGPAEVLEKPCQHVDGHWMTGREVRDYSLELYEEACERGEPGYSLDDESYKRSKAQQLAEIEAEKSA